MTVQSLRLDVKGGGNVEFLKEAIFMGQLYHRNVVTMHGVVVDSDPVIEWIGPLNQLCLARPLVPSL